MSLQQRLAISSTFSTPVPSSLPPCPWMPLDGLIQLWAIFGNDACEVPQSADVLHATSQAFAALAQERAAFQHYSDISTGHRRHPLPGPRQRAWAAGDQGPGEKAFTGQGWTVAALHMAATHWLEVTRYLNQYATSCPQDEALQHDLQVLIFHARSQRLRVWTIAQHLLQDDVTYYRKRYGITTDLLDDDDDEGQQVGEEGTR